LRYFPTELHEKLMPEFVEEFNKYGHIYMYMILNLGIVLDQLMKLKHIQ